MIFPYLKGIRSFFEAPVTWLLFFINVAVMLSTMNQYLLGQHEVTKIFSDTHFLEVQGEFYAQYVSYNSEVYPESTMTLVKKGLLNNDPEKLQILGSLALRDRAFTNQIDNFSFRGDDVALSWWKGKVRELNETQGLHPSYQLGLDSKDMSFYKWLSYQFVHSGFVHFLGNMMFLLIFGCMLEPVIGGLALLVVYLVSGMLAAGTFLYLSGVSSMPLIGASGAVSGLIALFCFMFWRRPVRYFYFLFIPKRGYAGFVYLPGWVTLGIWALTDLAGYLGSLKNFGGVAHSAHLGGEFAGILVGLIVFLLRRAKKQELIPQEKLPVEYPIGTRIAY